jgi:hypothetical protein
MAQYGDPPGWQNQWSTSATSNITWTYSDNTVGYPVGYPAQPFIAVPVEPVHVDDSPLAWLREQITEICDLANAA